MDQVIASAAARKQVFCEKPLALHRDHAERMFGACRDAGVILAVGHNRRFWPSMPALREIAGSGELGTILHVEGHNSNENSRENHRGLAAVARGISRWRIDRRGPARARCLCQPGRDRPARSTRASTRATPVRRRGIHPCLRSISPTASPARWQRCGQPRFTGGFMCSEPRDRRKCSTRPRWCCENPAARQRR